MKFIGKENLIEILGKFESKTFSEKTIEGITDWYGDSFELDDKGNWVRSKKNDHISELLGDKYSDIGDTISRFKSLECLRPCIGIPGAMRGRCDEV